MVEGEEGAEEPRGSGEGGTLGLQPSQCGAPGSRRALRAGVGSHGEAWVDTGGRLSLVWPQSGELFRHEALRDASESRAAQHATTTLSAAGAPHSAAGGGPAGTASDGAVRQLYVSGPHTSVTTTHV
ncbi:hypothetical protein GWK47_002657 [Chionoecetes opilio]|uniref:Uncharacterized protein n=1 Tax=Chionoecetes opilio TaxID=41210 RepID=A0A8J5CCR0_CHIOP|nr:hypothetical protein GWK47_002657 [Chionoecetes opilio]